MPLLNNIVSSIKVGWANLNNDDNLTMLTFLSVTYVFLTFVNYSIISDSILVGSVAILGFTIQTSSLFIIIFTLSGGISFLIGSFFRQQYNRRLQLFSALSGLVFGFLLYLPLSGMVGIILYPILAGVVTCLATPNILAAFISKTDFHNRGSTAGIFVFLVYSVLFIFTIMVNSLREVALVLVILKIFSLFLSLRIREFKFLSETIEYTRTSTRTRYLFLLVWGIFLTSDVSSQTFFYYLQKLGIMPISGLYSTSGLLMISQVIGLFTIFFGGIMMDIFGRKRLMMFAFAYLGANYAIISFAPKTLYFFTVIDGIAFGILTVLFLLVLWGDICKPSNRAAWIASSLLLSIAATPAKIITYYLVDVYEFISLDSLFPLTSFFLFIAVVIILNLPETLPDKIIQKKELDDYIKMAKKVKEKYKNGTKS